MQITTLSPMALPGRKYVFTTEAVASVSENISVGEALELVVVSFIGATETIVVAENVNSTLFVEVSVQDNVGVVDVGQASVSVEIVVFDNIVVVETVGVTTVYTILVSDAVIVSELVEIGQILVNVDVSDLITVLDSVSVVMPAPRRCIKVRPTHYGRIISRITTNRYGCTTNSRGGASHQGCVIRRR